jgi:hypothetical protein
MGFSIIKENEYLVHIQKDLNTNRSVATKIHIPFFMGLACIVANITRYISPLPCLGFPHGVIAGYCIAHCCLEQRFVIIREDVTENNQVPVIVRQPINNNVIN